MRQKKKKKNDKREFGKKLTNKRTEGYKGKKNNNKE